MLTGRTGANHPRPADVPGDWRDCGDGGLLVAQVDQALTYPGISLPHNQYLALGNALIWLHRITGDSAYRDQAAKMARCFKSHLRLVDDHYDWNYWDAVGQPIRPDLAELLRPWLAGRPNLWR